MGYGMVGYGTQVTGLVEPGAVGYGKVGIGGEENGMGASGWVEFGKVESGKIKIYRIVLFICHPYVV